MKKSFTGLALLLLTSCNPPMSSINQESEKPTTQLQRCEQIISGVPTFTDSSGRGVIYFERKFYLFDPKTNQLLNSGSASIGGATINPPITPEQINDDYLLRQLFTEKDGELYIKND